MFDSLLAIFWATIDLLEGLARDYEGAVAVIAAVALAVIYAVLRPRRRSTRGSD